MSAFVALTMFAGLVSADVAQTLRFDIPSQPVASALELYARQAKVEFLIPYEALDGIVSTPVKGEFDKRSALELLLRNTGLEANFRADGAVQIQQANAAAQADGDQRTAPRQDLRLARSSQEAAQNEQAKASEPEAAQGDSKQGVQEVIVTATKRAQNIQDVPLSIVAISAEEIDRRGLVSAEDYLRGVPGVNQTGEFIGQAIVIRGIETAPSDQNFSSGTTVATYFGETPTTNSGGLGGGSNVDLKLVDIERVEVLRGPQGTAFGNSSLGGAVRTIPVAPKLDRFEAKVGASYSVTEREGGDNTMMQGVVNFPLVTDKLAVRATAYRFEDSGYYRNVAGSTTDPAFRAAVADYGAQARAVDGGDIGASRFVGGRISALFQPTDALKLTVSYINQATEVDGTPLTNAGAYNQAVLQVAPEHARRGQRFGLTDQDIDIVSALVEYDLGWANLLATYSNVDSATWYSYSSSVFPGFGIANPTSAASTSKHREHSGEIRLSTQFDGPVNFLAGVYSEKLNDQGLWEYMWGGAPAANFYAPGVVDMGYYLDDRVLKQKAAFGEVSWEFLPGFTLTGGGRAYDYDRSTRVDQNGTFFGSSIETNSGDASGTSLRGNLSYKPNEAMMFYAGWSQGFRLGKPQPGLLPTVCDTDGDGLVDGTNTTIASTRNTDSDEVDNYELGSKLSLLDRRLQLSVAAFRIDWVGMPVRLVAPSAPNGCGLSYNANAGSARSEGVEFEANAYVSEAVRVDFGASKIHARLTADAPSLGAVAGAQLPGSPQFNANFGVQYEFSIRDHKAYVRTDAIYVGHFYGDLLESPGAEAGDYMKFDVAGRVSINKLSVDVYARNITNADDFSFKTIYPTAGLGYRMRPRMIGLQLGYSF